MEVNGLDIRYLEREIKSPAVLLRNTVPIETARLEHAAAIPKRISIGPIPEQPESDNPTNESPLVMINPELDDGEMKRRRHLDRIAQRARVSGSPAASVSSGSSIPGRKFSGGRSTTQRLEPAQLRDYYSMCMRMSTENKIHGKTAFDLHLIDYISQLLHAQTDPNRVDFKLASGALDLGAKIYCNRVDFVHTETQRVASGLMLAGEDKKEDRNQGDEGDQNEPRDDEMDEAEEALRKRKKRERKANRKAKTIARSVDSINMTKIETNVETDPIFHRLAASFDMGVCNSSLMSNLEMGSDGGLLIDSKIRKDSVSKPFQDHPSRMTSISHFSKVINDVMQKREDIPVCHPISKFLFSDRDQLVDMEMARQSDEKSQPSYAFNINDDLSDEEQPEDPYMYDMGEMNPIDSNSNDIPREKALQRLSFIKAMKLESMEVLKNLLSQEKPNEYGYFSKKVLDTWAGPNYWRVNRLVRPHEDAVAAKTPRRRKKKEFSMINFHSDDHVFEPSSKRKLERLKEPTIKKWIETALSDILPESERLDLLDLARPFNKPESTYICNQMFEKSSIEESEITETTHQNPNFYSQSAVEEAPLSCRGLSVESDDDDGAPPAGFADSDDLLPTTQLPSIFESMPFTQMNMVDAPVILSDLNIHYARVATKMDVRKLKRAMWDMLVMPEDEPAPPTPLQDQSKEKAKHMGSRVTSFSQIYDALPQKITPIMAVNLSVPMAFVTLLHLANEKNLELKGSDDLNDFQIEQEPPEEEESLSLLARGSS